MIIQYTYKEIVSHKSQPCNKRLWNPISSLGGTLWFLWSKTNCFSIHALLYITKWIQEQPIISPQNCYGLMPKLDKCIFMFSVCLAIAMNWCIHYCIQWNSVMLVKCFQLRLPQKNFDILTLQSTIAYHRKIYNQVANNKVQFNPPDTWNALFLKRFLQSESAI